MNDRLRPVSTTCVLAVLLHMKHGTNLVAMAFSIERSMPNHPITGNIPSHSNVVPSKMMASVLEGAQRDEDPSFCCDRIAATEPGPNEIPSPRPVSWKDDGFVYGLEGSGLDRPKGRTAQIVVEGDAIETEPYQRVMVTLTFAGHAWLLSKALAAMVVMANGNVALALAQGLTLTFLSWVLADLGSGVLHWSVDNYGNGNTPVMGSIIAAFQGHHSAPWTITERGFCNNVHKLCIPFGIPSMAIIQALAGGPGPVTLFFATFCVFEILSQEFHKWSHQLPSESPPCVNWLQKVGLTVGRKPHALHHAAPFEGNYCIISGICNEPLDHFGIFRRIERLIYRFNGIEANAWKLDPVLREKTLRGDYRCSP